MSVVQNVFASYAGVTPAPLVLTSTPSATTAARQAYSQTNVASGGTPGYTYSIAGGSVPAGTSLNTSTGTVSGTPTTAGAFSYVVKVTDSNLSSTMNTVSGTISAVVAGSATYTSGSGNFTVPAYNTLTVEVWGAAAGGASAVVSTSTGVPGNVGGTSSCSTLSMSCTGGVAAPQAFTGVAGGGTASGGNTTNTTGGSSTAGGTPAATTKGNGGSSPNGGAASASTAVGNTNGNAGNAPGGGGSGATCFLGGNTSCAGGGGGAYSKSVFTFGAVGSPTISELLAWAVGTGGAGAVGSNNDGGAGANGQVKFTWS